MLVSHLPVALLLTAGAAHARVYDSLPGVPAGWRQVRAARPAEPIALHLGLRQTRAADLEQAVLEVSTPGHPSYGQHLSRDQVRMYTSPSRTAVSDVAGWLDRHGVSHEIDHDWVRIATTVSAAESLLNATFAWYERQDADAGGAGGAQPVLRTLEYSVEDAVAGHVDLVQPTTRFGGPSTQKSTIFEMTVLGSVSDKALVGGGSLRPGKTFAAQAAAGAVPASCNSSVTPACIRGLYNINFTAQAQGSLVGFASFLNENARVADTEAFTRQFVPQAVGQGFTVELINGAVNDQASAEDSGEANLDLQYILATSRPIPILQYNTAGLGPLVPTRDQPVQPGSNEPYLEFLTHLSSQPDTALPQTLSVSYGEEEQSVPQELALRVCNMFMQLGGRGVSVIFSSGDSGPGNNCTRNTDNATFFGPTFPAGCPFVTSVGATRGVQPEKAVAFSSGGFSIYHARPAYQDNAVQPFLTQLGGTYSQFFNASNRGIPDVAAQGTQFHVIDKGREILVSGTSASAPVFAGVVANLNAARKAKGQPPMGFLNPWLYQNADAAFTDITAGSSLGCRPEKAVFGGAGARWNATKGWDPVTGLGTPKFDAMLGLAAPGVPNA